MPTYIALLCAVNVGGTGKLAMADFANCSGLGFRNVETYIQSGNAVFDAPGSSAAVTKALSAALEKHMGSPVPFSSAPTMNSPASSPPIPLPPKPPPMAHACTPSFSRASGQKIRQRPRTHRYAISIAPRPLSFGGRHALSPPARWRRRIQIHH